MHQLTNMKPKQTLLSAKWLAGALSGLMILATSLTVAHTANASSSQAAPVSPMTFMALSDIHIQSGRTGDGTFCHDCETGSLLFKAALGKARSLVTEKNLQFIIYLGDLPAHNEGTSSRETEFATALDGLASIVSGTSIPVLYLRGNNDSIGVDYCTFTAPDRNAGNAEKTPLDFASQPSEWPVYNGNATIIDHNKRHGYYSAHPLGTSDLRVIALNTVMFTKRFSSPKSYFGCVNEQTKQQFVSDHLDWLQGQLNDASSNGEKVILAMHVPPGIDGHSTPHSGRDYSYMWDKHLTYSGSLIPGANGDWVQKVFLNLVDQHSASIVSLLSAHTHLNGIRMINNCSNQAVELNLSIPAVTTDHGSNSALKIISYDNDFELIEAETFYATEHKNTVSSQTPPSYYDFEENQSFAFSDAYSCAPGDPCYSLLREPTLSRALREQLHFLMTCLVF